MPRSASFGTPPRFIALIAVAAVCLVGPVRPAAAESAPEIEVGAFVGGHFFSSDLALGRGTNPTSDNALATPFSVGARVGLGLHGYFMPEIELLVAPTTTNDDRASVTVLGWRAHLMFQVLTGRVRPFMLMGYGGLSAFSGNQTAFQNATAGAFHTGLGLKFDITKHIGVRLDGRLLIPPSIQPNAVTEDFEVLLGVYGRFDLARHGGAEKPADADNDGVPDEQDKCPNVAGPRDNAGCPDKDSDGDGVVDRLDKCPAQVGAKDNGGCPDKDSDGDGVVDRLDKCPAEAGVKQNAGCPDKDTDGDGIVDWLDKCPNEPETKNGYRDDDGCPDEVPAAVAKFTGVIQGINFAQGKADILPVTFPVLDAAAETLLKFPSVRLEISGHTDNVGNKYFNIDLSERRAQAVVKYLVSKGVGEERLISFGFGGDKPIANNNSVDGRGKNRRVEFRLVSKAELKQLHEQLDKMMEERRKLLDEIDRAKAAKQGKGKGAVAPKAPAAPAAPAPAPAKETPAPAAPAKEAPAKEVSKPAPPAAGWPKETEKAAPPEAPKAPTTPQ